VVAQDNKSGVILSVAEESPMKQTKR